MNPYEGEEFSGGASGLNGNGNGIIDEEEFYLFWTHIHLAGFNDERLISRYGHSWQKAPGVVAGVNVPAAQYRTDGGCIEIAAPEPEQRERFFAIAAAGEDEGKPHCYNGLMSPELAFSLDKKKDDGLPIQGSVQAVPGAGYDEAGCLDENGENYALNDKDESCIAHFELSY